MTPQAIAEDAALRLRYQTEVAYRDRAQPRGDEADRDRDVLASDAAVLVIAWLWPQGIYDNDPFAIATRLDRELLAEVESRAEVSHASVLQDWTRIVGARQQHARRTVADRFRRILESVARSVDRSATELNAHLMWTVPLTELELERLLKGEAPFPFPVIAGICDTLGLRFEDEMWWLANVPHLAEQIDQSVLASEIAGYLQELEPTALAGAARRLPPRSPVVQRPHSEVYSAPKKRYEALYVEFANNEESKTTYTLEEIDSVLRAGNEDPLPPSARDRSWWAGSGARPEGRPQVSAWWGAGYRVRNTLPHSGDVERVEFEALPGRELWLANPNRTETREYRVPLVPIYPADARGVKALAAALQLFATTARQAMPDLLGAASDHLRELSRRDDPQDAPGGAAEPDDPDVRVLVGLLEEVDGATRSDIVDHFTRFRGEVPDDSWVTNLLTKARRQGWIANHGSRTRPRWMRSDLGPTTVELEKSPPVL